MSDFKKRVHDLVEAPAVEDRISHWFKLSVMVQIVLSVASVVLETVPTLHARWSAAFSAFELVTVVIFTAEYLARLWVCDQDPRYAHPVWGRLRFASCALCA